MPESAKSVVVIRCQYPFNLHYPQRFPGRPIALYMSQFVKSVVVIRCQRPTITTAFPCTCVRNSTRSSSPSSLNL